MNETPQDPHTPPPHAPPPHEPHQAVPPPATPVASSQEERLWALAAHLSALSFFVTGIGAVIGPLIVWLIKRDEMPFVNDQGREALNFNITIALAAVALFAFGIITLGVGFLLALPGLWLLGIYWLVMVIIAAIKAHEGVAYRYPFTLRLVN